MRSTDDGKIHATGVIVNNINATNNATLGIRGGRLMRGTFTGGVFSWTGDSIIPATVLRTDGSKQLCAVPIFAWNNSGVGYMIFIGSRQGATASNQGWQPIIYKTTNYGTTWFQTASLDFNTAPLSQVKASLKSITTNSSLAIPYFNQREGISACVDGTGKLHIAATICSTKSSHPDSLDICHTFNAENYLWPHTPGARPYLYDFYGDGITWTYKLIDSLSTECPGEMLGTPGYTDNPWDPNPADNNRKVSSGARIQLSTDCGGDYVLYSWAESDTTLTPANKKWNVSPNIKARLLNANNNILSVSKFNITSPPSGANPNLLGKAFFHCVPLTFAVNQNCSVSNTVPVILPLTVANSSPYSQLGVNRVWYSSAALNFLLSMNPGCACQNINRLNEVTEEFSFDLYPNPTNAELNLSCSYFAKSDVTIIDVTGKIMRTMSVDCKEFKIDVKALPPGLYFIKLESKDRLSVRKFVKW